MCDYLNKNATYHMPSYVLVPHSFAEYCYSISESTSDTKASLSSSSVNCYPPPNLSETDLLSTMNYTLFNFDT